MPGKTQVKRKGAVYIGRGSGQKKINDTSAAFDDFLNVTLGLGPVFATLTFYTRYFSGDPIRIRYLWKKDAIVAKKLCQGLIICKQKNIKTRHLDKDRLFDLAVKVGSEVDLD